MGVSTNAMLVYGYNLGSDESWGIEELDEYDSPSWDWYDPEDEESEGFEDAAMTHLLKQLAGFTKTWSDDGYWEERRKAEAQVGVEIETHCSGDYPMYLLAAKAITAYRGDVDVIDFAKLTTEVQEVDADTKLRAALGALGIQPKQKQAQWLLCSYWG